MKNNKLITTILCTSLLGATFLSVSLSKKSYLVNAEECTHTDVVHYDGVSPTGGSGYVEHWACCECHKAWADEARTVLIGNTTSNRSKIDISGIYLTVNHQPVSTGEMQWSLPMEPVYDAGKDTTAYVFDGVDSTAGFWVETQGATELSTGQVARVSFYNGTDHDLNLRLRARQWGAADAPVAFPRNAWKDITIGADYWNHDAAKGFAFDMWADENAEFKGTIKATAPVVEVPSPEPYVAFGAVAGEDITIEGAGWAAATRSTNDTYGDIFVINYSGEGSFATNNGKTIDPVLYAGVEFYIFSDVGTTLEMNSTPDWSHYTNYTCYHGTWTRGFISASDWNIAKTHYFYPTAPAGTILISYFTAIPVTAE